jgi:hypothetical protein
MTASDGAELVGLAAAELVMQTGPDRENPQWTLTDHMRVVADSVAPPGQEP